MSHEKIRIGKNEFAVLFSDLPGTTPEEDDLLKTDIAENGVLLPIVVDEELGIIDGIRRARIASQLQFGKMPFVILPNRSPQDKRHLAVSLNANRRQWSRDEKRKIATILRQEQFSLNRIAGILAVGTETVRRWLTSSNEKVELPETVIGRDGVERPATMRRKPVIMARSANEVAVLSAKLADSSAMEHLTPKIIYGSHLDRELNRGRASATPEPGPTEFVEGDTKLYLGDFREQCERIPDNSIHVIFTDPPYSAADIVLYEDLAAVAGRVLVPGGILLTYCGNMYIPTIHKILGEAIEYVWMFSVRHTGGNTPVHSVKIFQSYKPILAYQKPPRRVYWQPFADMTTGGKSKTFHKWEQPESEAEYFLHRLCPHPGATVLDPMMGSGSIIMAGLRLGMKCYGIEIDPMAYHTAKQRVEHLQKNPKSTETRSDAALSIPAQGDPQ